MSCLKVVGERSENMSEKYNIKERKVVEQESEEKSEEDENKKRRKLVEKEKKS